MLENDTKYKDTWKEEDRGDGQFSISFGIELFLLLGCGPSGQDIYDLDCGVHEMTLVHTLQHALTTHLHLSMGR